jgi:DNA-binding response OmpR family regulator
MWRSCLRWDGFDYRPIAPHNSDAVKRARFPAPVKKSAAPAFTGCMRCDSGQGTVLLVEDSATTRELLATVLRRAGYRVAQAGDGEDALQAFGPLRPDAVVLDVHLPGISGWEVLSRLRERSEVPILMLTAVADESSKVRALNGGADDYLVKPTGAAELVARIGALLRRARRVPGAEPLDVYDDGLVRVEFDYRRVVVAGREVQLTPLEYRLLSAFVRHPGITLSREDLLRQVWHDETGGPSDHVKIYVGYLRRKLGDATVESLVETVRGFGYRWLRHGDADAALAGTWRAAG